MGKKLGEIKTTGELKINMVGDPGCGKTIAACSLAKDGKLLAFDFDGKIDSAALFYKDQTEIMDNIMVEELSPSLIDDPIERLNQIIEKDLIPQQRAGELEYKTIVIDSITTFSRAALKHIVRTNPGIKRVTTKQGVQPGMQDYGILRREFARLIPGLLSLPCNVIMTSHVSVTKNDITGEIIRGPVMDGSFSQELGVYFKEVWYLSVDKGKRLAQTQSDYKYKCRSQIPGLPNPLDITAGLPAAIKGYL